MRDDEQDRRQKEKGDERKIHAEKRQFDRAFQQKILIAETPVWRVFLCPNGRNKSNQHRIPARRSHSFHKALYDACFEAFGTFSGRARPTASIARQHPDQFITIEAAPVAKSAKQQRRIAVAFGNCHSQAMAVARAYSARDLARTANDRMCGSY